MKNEHRKDVRYEDSGRVEAKSLCALPGVLDDISISGCKVRFPLPIEVDMDNDYDLKMNIPHTDFLPVLRLTGRPQWKKRVGSQTQVGFAFLYSPGTPALNKYINHLKSSSTDYKQSLALLLNANAIFVK